MTLLSENTLDFTRCTFQTKVQNLDLNIQLLMTTFGWPTTKWPSHISAWPIVQTVWVFALARVWHSPLTYYFCAYVCVQLCHPVFRGERWLYGHEAGRHHAVRPHAGNEWSLKILSHPEIRLRPSSFSQTIQWWESNSPLKKRDHAKISILLSFTHVVPKWHDFHFFYKMQRQIFWRMHWLLFSIHLQWMRPKL